jgi:hypothetical protein
MCDFFLWGNLKEEVNTALMLWEKEILNFILEITEGEFSMYVTEFVTSA